MKQSTIALLTIPLFTGVIGYVTNWTGVLMLFYPVQFKGWRSKTFASLARLAPRRIQQIPGVMLGGIGWQGIVPSRAAKMGSLAVDAGIAKLGTPGEYWGQFDPDEMARQIVDSTRDEMRETVDRIMSREHPRLWADLPPQIKDMVHTRVLEQVPTIVRELTDKIGKNIDQLLDIKLMVIRRFEEQPELANRIFLDMGRRELKFIQNFGFVFGFACGIPVAAITHFVNAWYLLPILGVIVGWVTNWLALWMIYEPAYPHQIGPFRIYGLFIRRQPELADVYARIVSDEILTMHNFGEELLHGPRADRTRAMIESSMRPAIDRATGPARVAVRVALGPREYDRIREAFAAEPVEQMMTPLEDPEFSRAQSATMRKLIGERMRAMKPEDFGELLRTATKQDEWLLLLHGAVLGFGAGLIHLAIFG
ncbi:MAG TPA: hypothetical protein VG410_00105 [Solirubrobacteraceae bacterium]|nr:hypothetical protein [Solirubrobacteraceae bacterium]